MGPGASRPALCSVTSVAVLLSTYMAFQSNLFKYLSTTVLEYCGLLWEIVSDGGGGVLVYIPLWAAYR